MTTILDEGDIDLDSPEWQNRGLCRRLPSITIDDYFYEGRFRDNSPKMVRHIAHLRAVCGACPVAQECDEWADVHAEDGFWAGLTDEERHQRRAGAVALVLVIS